MKAVVPKWLGWTWVGAGALTAVASLLGGIVVWSFVGSATQTTSESISATRELLSGVSDTTAAVDAVFVDVAASLREVQVTLADASLTLTRASIVVDDLGELITAEIPTSIDAVTDSMPALIDTAGVVDTAMRGLSFFGVDYEAEVPLDESLDRVAVRLGAISPLLRGQDEAIEAVADDLGYFGGVTTLVSDDVGVIRARLVEASRVVDDYEAIVATTDDLLVSLSEDLDRSRTGLRVAVALVVAGLTVTSSVPIVLGWHVVRPETDGGG